MRCQAQSTWALVHCVDRSPRGGGRATTCAPSSEPCSWPWRPPSPYNSTVNRTNALQRRACAAHALAATSRQLQLPHVCRDGAAPTVRLTSAIQSDEDLSQVYTDLLSYCITAADYRHLHFCTASDGTMNLGTIHYMCCAARYTHVHARTRRDTRPARHHNCSTGSAIVHHWSAVVSAAISDRCQQRGCSHPCC